MEGKKIKPPEYYRLKAYHLARANAQLPDMEKYLDELWKVGAADFLEEGFFDEQRLLAEIRMMELLTEMMVQKNIQMLAEYDLKLLEKGILQGFREKDFAKAWHERQIEKSTQRQKELDREILKLEYIPKNQALDIDRARNFPITELVKVNPEGFARCVFHEEKTASMKIYKDNHFHCYGCDKTGDVITLAMEVFHLSFVDTVKRLQ